MTQPDDLQTQLTTAMAHNPMLRETLNVSAIVTGRKQLTHNEKVQAAILIGDTLNATDASVTAWLEEKTNDAYNRGAQSAYSAHAELRESYEQQLTTVTNERDALRRYARHLMDCHRQYPLPRPAINPCTCGLEALLQKSICTHSATVDTDYKGDGSPDLVLSEEGGRYTACTDYTHSDRAQKGGES